MLSACLMQCPHRHLLVVKAAVACVVVARRVVVAHRVAVARRVVVARQVVAHRMMLEEHAWVGTWLHAGEDASLNKVGTVVEDSRRAYIHMRREDRHMHQAEGHMHQEEVRMRQDAYTQGDYRVVDVHVHVRGDHTAFRSACL
jgi:hypothetical protein